MIPGDNTRAHIRQLILRYRPPEEVRAEALRLGGQLGLEVVRQWVRSGGHGGGRGTCQVIACDIGDIAQRVRVVDPPEEERSPDRVKVYPELSRLALLSGEDRALRLWYLARLLDAQEAPDGRGDGWVGINDLTALANSVEVSKRSVAALLRTGEGLFWQVVAGRLLLVGLERVSIALGCELGPGRGVWVPLSKFRRLEAYRAHLYAAWFASKEDGQIITRGRLMELFGRTRQCLRRWEKLAGIATTKVLAYARPRTMNTPPEIAARYPDASRTWKERIGRREAEVWQLPNHFASGLTVAAKGMLRRIRRACRRAFESVDGLRLQRVFFDDPRGACKALQGGQSAYLRDGFHHRRRLYAFVCA